MKEKGRILIIDDNPKNIQVAASILNQSGFECEFALDGASGLSWLESKPFDLVLLDVMMPGEDGFEICRLMKSNASLQKIPVIFVTAKVDRESIVMGFEAGGTDYITKPFDTKELLVRVKNQIELKSNRELLEKMNSGLEQMIDEKTVELSEANQKLSQFNNDLLFRNAELKRLEESKQHFLNMLGNEVSGSLNEITGMLQVIKYKVDSRKVAQLIDRIDHSLGKIESFVHSALRVTELQSKGALLKPERIDINRLLGFAMFQLDEKIRRKQIKVDNSNNSTPVFVTGESQLLLSALIIILDFFLERNLNGSSIKFETENKHAGLSVNFIDNGTNASEEEITSFFDLFYTGGQSLNFARIIAEAHLGGLTVLNKPSGTGIILNLELFTQ
jgi:two-component system, sensor histidine kinase and response regulator